MTYEDLQYIRINCLNFKNISEFNNYYDNLDIKKEDALKVIKLLNDDINVLSMIDYNYFFDKIKLIIDEINILENY